MTPKERVLRTLNHKEPDRIPVELGSSQNSTITLMTHKLIAEYFEESFDDYNLYNWADLLVYPDERLQERLGTDFRSILSGLGQYKEPEDLYRNAEIYPLNDGSWGWKTKKGFLMFRKPVGSYAFQSVGFPLSGDIHQKKVKDFFSENPELYSGIQSLDNIDSVSCRAKELYDKNQYAVVQSGFLAMVVTPMQILMGFYDWYVNLGLDEKGITFLSQEYLDTNLLPFIGPYFSAIGKYIDIAECVGDDMADQRGPCFNIDQYRRVFKPMHQKIINEIKKYTNAKIMFHICGSAYDFIPDLIDIGVDVINPVQNTAANMNPLKLKKEFGRDIVFWGGIDTQYVLKFGNKQEIYDEVTRKVEILGKEGGYIVAPCHNILPDTPIENIITMFESIQSIYKE